MKIYQIINSMPNKMLVCLLQLIPPIHTKGIHDLISYLKLTQRIEKKYKIKINHRKELSKVIGDISHIFKNAGYDVPLISVLVYNKKTKLPGNGFWTLYNEIKGTEIPPTARLAKYREEVKAVRKYDWSDIFKIANKIAIARGI